MNWLDKMLSGMGVPNIAGEQNAALAANPTVQAARGPGGSFDPTRLGNSLGPDAQPGLDYLSQIYDMQRGAVTDATKPPTQTGLQFLGRALSAASVPVAYAQGNEGFGRAMTGRTGADQWNQRVSDYEDAARKAQIEMAGSEAQGYGSYGLDYLKDKREKTASARKTLAGILAAGRKDDGSLDAASLADAELFANSNGFQDEWEQIKATLPKAMPSPVGQGAPGGATVSSEPSMAGDLPGAEKLPTQTPYARPPEIDAMYRQAHRVMAVDPERGKAMLESAQIADRAAASVWQKKAESQFDARSGEYSTSNTANFRNRKTGEMRPGQYGSKGGVKISDVLDAQGNPVQDPNFNPADWEYIGPAEMAGMKSSFNAQGTAQGTAAASLPKVEDDYSTIMDLADRITKAPGLKNLTGKSLGGLVWSDQLPDFYEETGDARALVQGLDSKAFTIAFESLKGAGAITEKEGEAATLALSRLKNMRVSDEGYAGALADFVAIVKKLRRQAYEKAQAGFQTPGYAYERGRPTVPPPRTSADYSTMSDDDFLKSRPGAR